MTTICASLLTYLEHVLRHHRQGEAQEEFLKKLRKCFTASARDFAKSCRWNDVKQSIETPADKHMEHIMQAVESRFAFDMSEMEGAPKSGIRARQEDASSTTTQASLGLDMNCFSGEDLQKAVVVRDSIPPTVNVVHDGESRLKKPKPNAKEAIPVADDEEVLEAEEALDVEVTQHRTEESAAAQIMAEQWCQMAEEMTKMRDFMTNLQAEVQGGKEREEKLEGKLQEAVDGGKERDRLLQAEIHRLTTQLAATNVVPVGHAAQRSASQGDLDEDMPEHDPGAFQIGGSSRPDDPTAMDTGTPTRGAGGTA